MPASQPSDVLCLTLLPRPTTYHLPPTLPHYLPLPHLTGTVLCPTSRPLCVPRHAMTTFYPAPPVYLGTDRTDRQDGLDSAIGLKWDRVGSLFVSHWTLFCLLPSTFPHPSPTVLLAFPFLFLCFGTLRGQDICFGQLDRWTGTTLFVTCQAAGRLQWPLCFVLFWFYTFSLPLQWRTRTLQHCILPLYCVW